MLRELLNVNYVNKYVRDYFSYVADLIGISIGPAWSWRV
jgi:hypothetical protein